MECMQVYDHFLKGGISELVVPTLTDEDLTKLGIPYGAQLSFNQARQKYERKKRELHVQNMRKGKL